MTKLKIVALLAMVALFLFPAAAFAQIGPPVCFFYGTLTYDGLPVIEGTTIGAWIDGVQQATATATNATYSMQVAGDFEGKTVFFTIGLVTARQTSVWTRGGRNEVNLTYVTPGPLELKLGPSEGFAATLISGTGFAPLSAITIDWAGTAIATMPPTVTTDQAGAFQAIIAVPTSKAAKYDVTATDALGTKATASFTVVDKTGPAGAKGEAGLPGVKGDTGAAGPAGAAGAMGKQGLQGVQGDTGPQGAAGPQGPAGKDAPGGLPLQIAAIVLSVIAIILAIVLKPRAKKA